MNDAELRMFLSDNDKDKAFPTRYANGLTKRELFAAMIFAQSSQDIMNSKAEEFAGKTFGELHDYCATVAVHRADALIKALASTPESAKGDEK